MSPLFMSDRSMTCPHCNATNQLVGSGITKDAQIACSRCGNHIGVYADFRPALMVAEPPAENLSAAQHS